MIQLVEWGKVSSTCRFVTAFRGDSKFGVYSVLLFVCCNFIYYFAGNDRGTQYRSGFYYFNEEQEKLIKASKEAYEARLEEKTGMKRAITTEIAAASDYDKYGGLWYYGGT